MFYRANVFVSDMKLLGASDILEAIFNIEEGNIDCGISSLSLSNDTCMTTISSQEQSLAEDRAVDEDRDGKYITQHSDYIIPVYIVIR